LGDSRKYPYHTGTTGSILEFRGRREVSWTGILKATQFGILNTLGGRGGYLVASN